MSRRRLLVPLSESVTARQTVDHAVGLVLEAAADDIDGDADAGTPQGGRPAIHLVVATPYDAEVPDGPEEIRRAERLVDRAAAWADEDLGDRADAVDVETAVLGADEYLFGPRDYARAFDEYAADHDLDCAVLDPEYRPGVAAQLLQPLQQELDRVDLSWLEAPVDRPARHERLVGQESFDRLFALFWISFGFYLVLGDPTYPFDLITGAAVAAIVSLLLSHVTFAYPLHRVKSPLRVLRFVLYVPYLAFEIVRANVAVSLVILRPSMPIEPTLARVDARVRSGLPLLALANSITLTPGTLTVRANDQELIVHTLIPSAREDLFDGGLERAVRFVFHGREAAGSIPTPEERGDAEIVRGEDL